MAERTFDAPRPRRELQRRRAMRKGWLCVAVGLILPFLALGGAWIGWSTRDGDHRGGLLAIAGVGVFAVRLVLWSNGIP